jgi:hypothetical protein
LIPRDIANGIGAPYINTKASIKGGKHVFTSAIPLVSARLYLGQFYVSICCIDKIFAGRCPE